MLPTKRLFLMCHKSTNTRRSRYKNLLFVSQKKRLPSNRESLVMLKEPFHIKQCVEYDIADYCLIRRHVTLSHFAVINAGKAGFQIVPTTPLGNAYIARCRGMMTYSKLNIALSAVKRMETTLNKRIKRK